MRPVRSPVPGRARATPATPPPLPPPAGTPFGLWLLTRSTCRWPRPSPSRPRASTPAPTSPCESSSPAAPSVGARPPSSPPSPPRTSPPRSPPSERGCAALAGARSAPLGAVLQDVADALPGHAFASARAGVEMAVIDAVANSIRIPLWRLFGGASNSVTTDITIPIVTPNEAAQLAAKYRGQGFQTLKLKVGENLNSDIEVLKAIRLVHPDCSFILDANEGYTANQATEVLDRLNGEMNPLDAQPWRGRGAAAPQGGLQQTETTEYHGAL